MYLLSMVSQSCQRLDDILAVGPSALLSGGLFCILSFLFPKSLFAYLTETVSIFVAYFAGA